MIFDYPAERQLRRHGPSGYADCESYRPWLRDEFTFRCVYCLKRETWGQVKGEFDIDHFRAQSVDPLDKLDYGNLVYACHRCNLVKSDRTVSNPLARLISTLVVMQGDGMLHAHDTETQQLIEQIDLNSPAVVSWRLKWLRLIALAADNDNDPELVRELLGFPNDLPDLGKRTPPVNHRVEGLQESWFEQRRRGILPANY